MPEYLEDPSVLTKDKLKSELLAHNVELPSGNPTKDVYVQLYLENLTAQNHKRVPAASLDAFSSDEELPPPVVSSRSRSSGRKATRKTDKAQPDELDVTALTDEGLRDELLKQGLDVGPIVASTRKLYEKKLQKLLDDGPSPLPAPQMLPTDIQVNHNGNSESDVYSDKEDEVTPEPEPEPVVVERPLRSRGKTPVSTRTRSSQHQTDPDQRPPAGVSRTTSLPELPAFHVDPNDPVCFMKQRPHHPKANSSQSSSLVQARRADPSLAKIWSRHCLSSAAWVEKISASEQPVREEEKEVLKVVYPNDITSPTGITATCRRPIRGAAGRPVISSTIWKDENVLFSPKTNRTSTSSYSESHAVSRVGSLPPSTSLSSAHMSSSRLLAAAPPAGQSRPARRGASLWMKLSLLGLVLGLLLLVYQAMETTSSSPFGEQAASSA